MARTPERKNKTPEKGQILTCLNGLLAISMMMARASESKNAHTHANAHHSHWSLCHILTETDKVWPAVEQLRHPSIAPPKFKWLAIAIAAAAATRNLRACTIIKHWNRSIKSINHIRKAIFKYCSVRFRFRFSSVYSFCDCIMFAILLMVLWCFANAETIKWTVCVCVCAPTSSTNRTTFLARQMTP